MATTTRPKPPEERIALSDLAYEFGFWRHDGGHLLWEAIGEDPSSGLWHQLLTRDQEATFRSRIHSWQETGPRSCLWCRDVEPNAWLLNNNHGEMGIHRGHCAAQYLTRNHVRYHVKRLTEGQHCNVDKRTGKPMRYSEKTGWSFPDGQPVTRETSRFVDHHAVRPLSKRGRELEIVQLQITIERAAELWSHMPDLGWLDDARTLLAREKHRAAPPDHHQVQVAGDDTALFEVA